MQRASCPGTAPAVCCTAARAVCTVRCGAMCYWSAGLQSSTYWVQQQWATHSPHRPPPPPHQTLEQFGRLLKRCDKAGAFHRASALFLTYLTPPHSSSKQRVMRVAQLDWDSLCSLSTTWEETDMCAHASLDDSCACKSLIKPGRGVFFFVAKTSTF